MSQLNSTIKIKKTIKDDMHKWMSELEMIIQNLEQTNDEESSSDSTIDQDELECIEWSHDEEKFINLYAADIEEEETTEQITIKSLISKEITSIEGLILDKLLM
ncbi:12668_t:CDS:2 [Funneliformis geosporum]|nr:12668_t:CDS:2 [Funneliformis geosporum]